MRGGGSGVSNGTLVGGGLGAAGGAAIGAATTNSVAGALVGGLLGAVGGAIAGTAIDSSGGGSQRGIEVTVQKDDGQTVVVAQADNGDVQMGDRVRIVQDRNGVASAIRELGTSARHLERRRAWACRRDIFVNDATFPRTPR